MAETPGIDAFNMLKDGTSFDFKRFPDVISLFNTKRPRPKTDDVPIPVKKIKVSVDKTIQPIESFQSLFQSYTFPEGMEKVICSQYSAPTAIQKYTIPGMIKRQEVIGIAPTGSGKSLAFIIPLLYLLQNSGKLRGAVIAPTKELAKQLFREILYHSQGSKITALLLKKRTEKELKSFNIIVTTPLNLVNHLKSNSLKSIKYIVFDECDQLLDMGYLPQVDEIARACTHPKVRKFMFSATILPEIEILARTMMIAPVKVVIGLKNTTVDTVQQKLEFCSTETGKLLALRQLKVDGKLLTPALIFVQSKRRAIELFSQLKTIYQRVGMIHSGMLEQDRERTVIQFRQGTLWFLICTDLMSRGIDFKHVNLVINYDFPQSLISYIHRIGRAGRAGSTAHALTLYTFEDLAYVKIIVNVMKRSGCEIPEWLKGLKTPGKKARKELETKPPKRESISGAKESRTLRKFRSKQKKLAKKQEEEVVEQPKKKKKHAKKSEEESAEQPKKKKKRAKKQEEEIVDQSK